MTTTAINPTAQVKVNFFVSAKFPSLNKNDWFEDYESQLDETPVTKALVVILSVF